MNNKRPAFIVEGDLEQGFIQNVCPGAPVQKLNCNGKSVCISSIAKRVGTLGRLLHKRYSPLVVIFDREQREESVETIRNNLIEDLKCENLECPVIIGIADRDVESWILADAEIVGQALNISIPIDQFSEGSKGKSFIKRLMPSGRCYVETVDGVAWLKASRAEIIKNRSHSFAIFAQQMADLKCWWLQQA